LSSMNEESTITTSPLSPRHYEGHATTTDLHKTNRGVLADVFANPQSIRSALLGKKLTIQTENEKHQQLSKPKTDDPTAGLYVNHGFEITESPQKGNANDSTVLPEQNVTYVTELRKNNNNHKTSILEPFNILGEFGGKSIDTTIKTSQAAHTVADSAIKTILALSFSKTIDNDNDRQHHNNTDERDDDGNESDIKPAPSYVFDPPKSRFEWRRTPVPARFLGVKDHAALKDLPHKIFLNASISEVLCTTTAEALAMGKFAVIPNHPSNDFFLQFPNCLAYRTMDECVEKLQYALSHDPEPLTEEQAYTFTWEAATERLIKSSIVTKRDVMERDLGGIDKRDERAAWIHAETGKKHGFLRKLFTKDDDTTASGGEISDGEKSTSDKSN